MLLFSNIKKKFIDILKYVDDVYFSEIINQISTLEAGDNGFSDLISKAKLIHIVTSSITKNYYQSLNYEQKLCLQMLFDDELEERLLTYSS